MAHRWAIMRGRVDSRRVLAERHLEIGYSPCPQAAVQEVKSRHLELHWPVPCHIRWLRHRGTEEHFPSSVVSSDVFLSGALAALGNAYPHCKLILGYRRLRLEAASTLAPVAADKRSLGIKS
jgi:hypothetical protein